MRHALLSSVVALCLGSAPIGALEVEDHARFGPDDATVVLDIVSTADTAFFAPLITSFLEANPTVAVSYTVASSSELSRAVEENATPFDLAISSAMDLQTKLANDGFAQSHQSDATARIPDWANWNNMVFAFTEEPAAIVLSNAYFEDATPPRSRQDLIATLRDNPERFQGRVGTYDVRASGLGYLFATQDARMSETYWRLTEVMGSLDASLYCCSSDMIDDVIDGDLAIAYNVLASYALEHPQRDAYTVILPTDFTTLMLRSVLIPSSAERPDTAKEFVDHLLEQSFSNERLRLARDAQFAPPSETALRRIELGPALLVYLDRFKRRSFIEEWESAILR